MTAKVKILPPDVIKKIAAGEVIQGPHSVVKELVENSIDAGADEIYLNLLEGGKSKITVRDNGCGMGREDLLLAFQSHSTSKILKAADILKVTTFGFRGEALSSIAAVSRVEAISREKTLIFPDAEEEATRILIEEGKILKVEGVGHPPGTTIHVKELFFCLPVRKNSLRSPTLEGNKIIETLRPIVLSHPSISFKLEIDQREVFNLNGEQPLLERIAQVFTRKVREELFYIKREKYPWGEIEGYLCLPDFSKRSSRDLYIIINGRPVKNEEIKSAVEEAYGRILMKGKHPWGVIFLKISHQRVDVNVHPQKLKVKITREGEILKDVTKSIAQSLSIKESPPEKISIAEERPLMIMHSRLSNIENRSGEEGIKVSFDSIGQMSFPEQKAKKGRLFIKNIKNIINIPSGTFFPPKEPPKGKIDVVGQLWNRYIVLETEEDVFIVDQHAADERIRLEEAEGYLNKRGKPLKLIDPIYIDLPIGRVKEVEVKRKELKDLGIEVESFGEDKVVIRSIPPFLRFKEAEEVLKEFLEGYGNKVIEEEKERLINKYACKGAIKSGEKLTNPQIMDLIRRLLSCRDPLHCAHGRPTILKSSKKEFDRAFKRIV